jgi:hypothetical protein
MLLAAKPVGNAAAEKRRKIRMRPPKIMMKPPHRVELELCFLQNTLDRESEAKSERQLSTSSSAGPVLPCSLRS